MSKPHHDSLIRELNAVLTVQRYFQLRRNRTMIKNTELMIETLKKRIDKAEIIEYA